MNNVTLVGRLTKDPDQRTTQSGIAVTSFTVAVQRRFKDADGNYQADFINCVAWRTTAEFIAKYFSKGMKIGICGTLQTRSYEDTDGKRRYVTEVVTEQAEFVESKGDRQGNNSPDYGLRDGLNDAPSDNFENDLNDFQPLDDSELPF